MSDGAECSQHIQHAKKRIIYIYIYIDSLVLVNSYEYKPCRLQECHSSFVGWLYTLLDCFAPQRCVGCLPSPSHN